MGTNQSDPAGRDVSLEAHLATLAVGPESGLSAAQAARRLLEDGPNVLPGGQRRSLLSIAADTVREPMFLLLLAAGTLYLVFGDLQEELTLLGFVVITLGLTLFQEGKTERAIEALRDDLLKLSEGDRVPADAVLVSVDGVRADESLLTGEAVPVGKRVAQPGELAAASNPAAGFPDPPHGRLRTSAEGVPAKTRRERRLVC